MRRLYLKYQIRLNIFKNVIIFLFTFILIKFFFIQVIGRSSYKKLISDKTVTYKHNKGYRGNIYDRNNNLLAYSTKKCIFWVDTYSTNDSDISKIINLFSNEFESQKSKYKILLNKKSKYLVIERDLIAYYHKNLINKAKQISSLRIEYYNHRLYPYNELAAQVIGFTDYENQGKYGIEGYFNNILSGSESMVEYNKTASGKTLLDQNNTSLPTNGSDIFLTIDVKIQEILQNQLKQALIINQAKSANGIIMNPYNGEIIAMASLPDFNLNSYKNLPSDSAHYHYINRVISSAYEPGSTFKIICFISAVDKNINSSLEKYFCEKGLYTGKYIKPFKDHDGGYDSLTFNEIFSNSSNIGTIKIFQDLSKDFFYDKIKKFGFGIKSNISLKDEHKGEIQPFNYYKNNLRDLASISIGQSILVTNLQMALAYCSIANGGYLLKPKIIKKINHNYYTEEFNTPKVLYKNMKKSTSKTILMLLQKTVEEGTAKKSYIKELEIGGKTGTAEIWNLESKNYSKKEFFASFASVFPIDNPKYVMIISIEAPDYNKRWAAESAVPCAKNIIQDIMFYDTQIINKQDKNNEEA
tara:strand:- start:2745 stop:4493 length:1749 start_codon:yes stop_codon:yes gene_type:complete